MSGAGKGKGKGKAKIQTQDKGKGKAKVPAQDKGKGRAKVPLEGNESKKTLSMNILAIRQRNARDAAKQLNMTTAQMIKVMEKQVELLENDLMRRKQEVDPHFLATVLATAEILDFQETNKELKSMLENREKLMKWLAAWVETYKVHKGGPNYMEVTLLQDDNGRRRGSVYMTNRAHMMSQNANPYKPFGCRIEDDTKVTAHLGEDANGVCVQAFECHVIFTVEANYENVAKTWRFDQTESTPIFSVKSVEDMDHDILYMIHEHNELKRKRIAISGIFRGYEGQDRITITHTGIAVDERYPFTPGEVRSNGFQWVIFEHVTDRLTIVRWSLLNYCPVNVNGSLSLLETAQSLRCPVSQYDSEEAIIERMCRVSEQGLMKIRDQFRGRCKRFLLEPFTMGSRDKFFDENH
ncbi:unnamed protein product [Aphanomyces euteiches]|uniref:Uncharacterized protein n=1 Tax=Aphanomyces euteiches TaxID=100861 RepID=A0A6G0WI46_9STRA|nr:hypothetical protein Ae201684_015008 [Aphanomyces euteiches]